MTKQYPLATVGILIVADDGEILLVHSPKWSVEYTIPGGKVEFGETREQAAIREALEETGLAIIDLRFALVHDSILSPEYLKSNHFVMNDFVARLDPSTSKNNVKLNEEGDRYIWIAPEKALNLSLNQELYPLIEWHLKNGRKP